MTEAQIIKGCQKEKAAYQKELVMRYSPTLMTVARRYCRDQHAAKDVLQDAFIKIFKAIPKYKHSGSFEGWLRRIVINCALSRREKHAFKKEQTALEDTSPIAISPSVYAHLEAEELMALIKQLPEGFQEVFNLFVIEGFSHNEIADILGISASTSRSQLVRARKKLQVILKQQEKQHYVKRQIG